MNTKYIFPLLSAFFSSVMLLCVEYLLALYSVHVIPLSVGYLCIGSIFLFCFIQNKVQKTKALLKQDFFLFITASLFAYVLSNILTFYSTGFIGATKMSFVLQLETLCIVVFAVFLLHEKITWKIGFGALCILCGGFLLHFSQYSILFSIPDLIALVAPVSFSIGIILNTKLVQRHEPLTVTAAGLLVGAIFLFCFSIFFPGFSSYNVYSTMIPFVIISFIGVAEAIAWLCYNKGLAVAGASVTSILFAAMPFFTLLMSLFYNYLMKNVFIIPENIIFVVIGGMLICAGISITSRTISMTSS